MYSKTLLGNILELHRGYDLPERERIEGNVPVISSSGYSGMHNQYKCDGENVITGRYGTIGEVFFHYGKCWPLNTALYVSDFKGNVPKYIYYLLKYALKMSIDGKDKSTVPGVDRNVLHKMNIPFCHDIDEQKKIIRVLELIDKKIEVNNMINDNLQQQIRLLYDYWFTQFDFPDKNGNPYKSSGGTMVWSPIIHRDIPVCWKVTKLLDIVSWESNSQPPKSEFIYEPKDGYIRFIQNRDYDSDNHQTYIPYTKNLSTVDKFDILMDKYGDAGAVRYGIEGAFNVALGKINVNRPNFQEYIRSFLESDGVYSYLHNSCMASTRASLNESNLSMLNVVIPDEDTLSAFQLQIRKIRESILLTNDENLQLEKLRNWLLPMLMNGQAVVQD